MYTTRETWRTSDRAVLYRGHRRADGKPVMIKVLSAQHRPQHRERLKNGYEVGRMLDLAAVVRPVALETYDGRPALVFEDCGDRSLDEQLNGPMELGRFLPIAILITAAVGDIHQGNVVHKDLKPENILVHPTTGAVRIAEFEIASTLPCQRQTSAACLIEGSLPYMSPEQTGWTNRALDQRSDLYSLGVTFYQLLTGRLPFQATDPLEWVHCHVARSPTPPAEVVRSVPRALSAIVMKLMAKDADDRYQSARGLGHDLERCLAQWSAHGRVPSFALGERDVSDRFQIPQKLYGREREIGALLGAFRRVADRGQPELVLVSGYSGSGKSTLVHELQEPIARERGVFASGKFDQFKREIPYATIVQAFTELVLELLAGSAERLGRWRERLQAALGVNGQLIAEVIPPLELVIGRQPPVPALPPAEAQNRFRLTLRGFIAVFAEPEHPLALFLDDLQWADLASLALLHDLVTHPEMRHVFVVGAYRDNEVSPAHPLMAALAEARGAGAQIIDVVLGPLSPEHLTAFVGDMLHQRGEEVAPLARLVVEKTGGNPFFAIQFLTALHDERLIELGGETGAWRCDLEGIRAKGFTDNVIDLMVGKLRRLSAATQEAVTQLACLGSSAELAMLALVLGCPEEDAHAVLGEAVRAGLLVRVGEGTMFVHDRVEEAAYSLIPEEGRAAAHLRIGRLFLAELPPEEIEERLFDVVNQLNRGVDLITDPAERQTLCRLDFRAGRKARAAIAYGSARSLLVQATMLLPPDAWEALYDETFALYLALAECEYLAGNFHTADELFELILRHARSDPDRGRVSSLRVRLYQVAGRYEEAMSVALAALRPFGVTCPATEPELRAAIEAGHREATRNLGDRRIADLALAPAVVDEGVRATIGLLVDALPCVYIARPTVFPLLVLEAINLSLRHGNAPESCFAYSSYGIVLTSIFDDSAAALEFSLMSLALNERLGDATLKGTLLFMHGTFINVWHRHVATSRPILEQGFRASLDVGDLVYAGYNALVSVMHLLDGGEPLDAVLAAAQRYKAFAAQSRNDVLARVLQQDEQFVAAMKGLTRGPSSLEDDAFSEAEALAVFGAAGFAPGIFYHHLLKHLGAFIHERWGEALASSDGAAPALSGVMSAIFECTHHTLRALTLAAAHQTGPAPPAVIETIEEIARRLERWAVHGPENFRNRRALVAAELARLQGRDLEAMRLYDEAIAAAAGSGFVHYEAIACETAARFYRVRGFDRIADTYLREARERYARWGADAKVKQIDRQHPTLRERRAPTATGSLSLAGAQIDLLSAIKASQTISGEIVLDRLVRTLLEVVLEQAGAQKVLLILARDRELFIEGEATLGARGVETGRRPSLPVASSALVPRSIIKEVERTKERIIVDNAMEDPRYAADLYVAGGRSRSIVCLPVLRQAELVALLYLENNLTSQAFTPERLVALELLAAQAAISLENAVLLANEQQARAAAESAREAAEVAERRLAFLAHELKTPIATALLKVSLLADTVAAEETVPSATLTPSLGGVKRQLDRLTLLIDNLLDLARMQRGRLVLAREPVDLSALAREVAARLGELAAQAGTAVELQADAPVVGRWDRLRLEQVVTNLLTNAFKYGSAGPIRVVVEAEGGLARLSVTDRGIGIPLEDQRRIFEPFERATPLHQGSSLGLGLYLVHSIVQAHDGRIQLHSRPGSGATFAIELPIA